MTETLVGVSPPKEVKKVVLPQVDPATTTGSQSRTGQSNRACGPGRQGSRSRRTEELSLSRALYLAGAFAAV